QVKSCGDITFGLVTQCVLPKTISDVAIKKSYSTMLNIAMKINMKIGGINTKLLEDEILDNYLYKNNALVIGVDVVHPSAVETHLPSIASVGIIHVVGNVDTKVTKFSCFGETTTSESRTDHWNLSKQFSERFTGNIFDVNGYRPPKKYYWFIRDGSIPKGQFYAGENCVVSINLKPKFLEKKTGPASSVGLGKIICQQNLSRPVDNVLIGGSKTDNS
ncbi:putative protein tag-76, partial [Trichinella spiralis]|uniref:putative protein tag-76 n=1 Tax=Trichinella spiralis TaxID=6334 RepID=UPI0001EFDAF4